MNGTNPVFSLLRDIKDAENMVSYLLLIDRIFGVPLGSVPQALADELFFQFDPLYFTFN